MIAVEGYPFNERYVSHIRILPIVCIATVTGRQSVIDRQMEVSASYVDWKSRNVVVKHGPFLVNQERFFNKQLTSIGVQAAPVFYVEVR